MKKKIETALPLSELSKSAIGDKARKGHPGNMHLWWSRSPINSSAALLWAAINDADASEKATDVIKLAQGSKEILKLRQDDLPIVSDPFSGFGGLALSAQRLGLKVVAGDINSVASLLTKAATEIAPLFANQQAVHPQAENKMYIGTQGLAEDVRCYGKWMKSRAKECLAKDYIPVHLIGSSEEYPAYAWVWVRTVKCPNPACGCNMPLATSYTLSKLKGREYWAEPEWDGTQITYKIHKGLCPPDKETNKHGSIGAKFQCPVCGTLTTDEYMKKAGKSGNLGIQMMAMSAETKEGRIFVEPDENQLSAADVALPEDIPIGSIPINSRWFSPPGFGMTEFTDIYTPRQLHLMTTLCDLTPEVQEQATADACRVGLRNDGISLQDGGTGATAYGQTIGVYLSLVIGKLSNFQSEICTWDNRKGNIRAAFTRQAMPMTWVFAEGNPFSSVTGNFDTMLKNVVESIEHLPTTPTVTVAQTNAITKEYPKEAILFTELPYYDNVGYADLSDYFYIWLRRCLKTTYPELFEKVVTSKEELSSIPEHYGGDAVAAVSTYRSELKRLCVNFYESASEKYPSIIFYEYSRQDDRILDSQETPAELPPFVYLLTCLREAGFAIIGTWPVRTKKPNTRFETMRIAIVFRKGTGDSHNSTRRGFINTLKRELPGLLDIMYAENVDDYDKQVSGLGAGLSIFTQYKQVINADGSDMNTMDALQIIYQEVKDYIDAHSAESHSEEV